SWCHAHFYTCTTMSPSTLAGLLVLLVSLWQFINLLRSKKNGRKLPPGPQGLPIIGNLHMLGNLPHRSFQKLAKKYGPIMSIRLGSVPTIVLSSPQAAELFLRTHDRIFASRPKVQSSEYLSYGAKGMAFTEYGPYWRNVRKFCTLELLTTMKIDSFAGMRREELGLLVKWLKDAAVAREVVDVSEKVAGLIEDMTYKMLFGRSKDERFDLKGTIQEAMFMTGAFNIADFVPFLRPLDLQGFTRRFTALGIVIDNILEIIISEHEHDAINGQKLNRDFVDVMLSMKNKPINTHDELSYTLDRSNIKAIILDMIVGSIGTSHTAIEWILTELIRHPRVMKKLQDELKTVIAVDGIVKEIDLPKLEYLDMVIKESIRLHPVAPLLVPRESIEDIKVQGYYIPKGSRVIVNTWALGLDPNVWSANVADFSPERFIGSNIDLLGRDFQLIPFGSGRRGCPGMNLGLTNIRLVVAQLVHCFNWELPNGMPIGELDMSENFGLSMPRANHLLAVPIARL
ncbi:hypothetical protein RJ640_010869, partial [Escallonia rubra]